MKIQIEKSEVNLKKQAPNLYRYISYVILSFNHILYQEFVSVKIIYSIICCIIAEKLINNKNIYSQIIVFLTLVLVINSIIPFIAYELKFISLINRKLIHSIKQNYLLSYQLYFLYFAVHSTACLLIFKREPLNLKLIILFSILIYGFTFLIDDRIIRTLLHSSAFVSTLFYYKQIHYYFAFIYIKKYILTAFYLIYSFILIIDVWGLVLDFKGMSYIYTIILGACCFTLLIPTQRLADSLKNKGFNYTMLALSLLLMIFEEGLIYKIQSTVVFISVIYLFRVLKK